MSISYPQTNLQLFNLIRELPYDSSELLLIRKSYEFAMQLFSGRYQSSGKPFIAHLVGLAGIFAIMKEDAEMVAAGLIHSAYDRGDFGTFESKTTTEKRDQVRQAVGPSVEDIVYRFSLVRWAPDTLPEIHRNLASMDRKDRQVVFMRVANVLEECLDGGVLFCNDVRKRVEYLRQFGPLFVDMAQELQKPFLAEELKKAFSAILEDGTPSELRFDDTHRISYVITPRSLERKFSLRLAHKLHAIKHRISRLWL